LTLGLAMLFGRFLFIIPVLAAAGSLASKKFVPTSAARCPRTGRCSSACSCRRSSSSGR
jgi:K+-transporting ATPase ATPase A chain